MTIFDIGSDTLKFLAEDQLKVRHYIPQLLEYQLSITDFRGRSGANIFKVISIAIPFPEVRRLASAYLESWLGNPIISIFAKDLYTKLISMCSSMDDTEAVGNLVSIKVKGPHANLLHQHLKQLLSNHPQFPLAALRSFLYKEVLPERSVHNHKLLSVLFQSISGL